jgi:hypothetical protein
LFDPQKNSSLDRPFVRSIAFSYPQDDLPPKEMELFHKNVEHAISRNIQVILSWVIEPGKDNWRQVIDYAARFRTSAMVRFSMVMPGHSKHFTAEEFQDRLKGLAGQILDIAHYAYENDVVFFFYRPLLPCMFDKEQTAFLRSISPFLFYTRCPLCLRGDYDADLKMIINPDLSCYPCTAIAFKGLKLTPDATRESINEYFKPLMRKLTAQPLMDSCRTCGFFINYQRYLENKDQDIAEQSVCQGGCFQYRA